jgi:hypothetical protein
MADAGIGMSEADANLTVLRDSGTNHTRATTSSAEHIFMNELRIRFLRGGLGITGADLFSIYI